MTEQEPILQYSLTTRGEDDDVWIPALVKLFPSGAIEITKTIEKENEDLTTSDGDKSFSDSKVLQLEKRTFRN